MAHDGGTVGLGSDFPSTPISMLSPLYNMQVAMTLIDPDDAESTPFPEERKRLTLEQALRAYTIDAARVVRMEDKIGSIEVGKYADLVILEKDVRTVPVNALKEVQVLEHDER